LGKPVIVATQMLESMIQNPIPTRAEVSDVATAIYDWADAVMLSGETAAGKYPVPAVKSMAKIATEVDVGQAKRKRKLDVRITKFLKDESIVSSLCDSADELADEVNAAALVVFTDTGSTALLLSKYRASVPIIAITDKKKVYHQMSLYCGVLPVLAKTHFNKMSGIKEMLQEVDRCSTDLGHFKKGDMVVMLAGIPIAKAGSTNMIRVHKIGEPL
jgi:pyruvate kinase